MYTRGLCIHWMLQQTDLSLHLNFSLISSSHAIASGIRRSKKRTFTYNELSYSMLYGMGERRNGIIPSSLKIGRAHV